MLTFCCARINYILAQIEDFQKTLDKEKFVVESDYIISLSKISDSLYEKIQSKKTT